MKTNYLFTLLLLIAATPLFAEHPDIEPKSFMTRSCLDIYENKYRIKVKDKAFAYARNAKGEERCGWGHGRISVSAAKEAALSACFEKDIGTECKVIDVNGVMSIEKGDFLTLNSPGNDTEKIKAAQLSAAESDEFMDKAVDMLERQCLKSFNKYMDLKGNKAFAYTVSEKGSYPYCARGVQPTMELAEKAALEKCNQRRENGYKDHTPACKLFARGSKLLVTPKDYGLTIKPLTLHVAAERKSLTTIKLLLDDGADINGVNNVGGSPLTEAAWEGRLDVVQYLLSNGADLHHKENMGFDAIGISAQRGNLKLFTFLLEQGGDINTQTERPGDMPIHHAASAGNVEMVELLLSKGVDLNIQNNFTETPLHGAADQGKIEVVKFLLEKGADINAQTRQGITPLDEAVYRKRKDVENFLRSKGAETNNPDHS